jgi:DNA-binding XRE family transcriptional regulator
VDLQEQQLLAVLGKAIRAVREEHGLLTSDLAVSAGIAEASIVALEDGRLDPTFALLLDLARGLGVRPAEVFIRAEELGARSGRTVDEP